MDGITGRNGHDGIEVLRERTVETAGNIINRWKGQAEVCLFFCTNIRRKIWK